MSYSSLEWSKWLYIATSSVIPTGLGLYAAINIPKGTLLPNGYTGLYITSAQYRHLLDDLDHPPSHSGNRKFISRLQSKYGIKIRPSDPSQRHETPQWDAISKGLSDYAFEGESGSDKVVVITILPVYDYQGKPVFDKGHPDNPYMLMNEPPDEDFFYNVESEQMQKSVVNVHPVLPSELSRAEQSDNSPALKFKTKVDIKAGDELFICYGSQYERSYRINMSTTCGCGQYDELAGNLASGITRKKYDTIVAAHNRVPPSILAPKLVRDERIRSYFDQIKH